MHPILGQLELTELPDKVFVKRQSTGHDAPEYSAQEFLDVSEPAIAAATNFVQDYQQHERLAKALADGSEGRVDVNKLVNDLYCSLALKNNLEDYLSLVADFRKQASRDKQAEALNKSAAQKGYELFDKDEINATLSILPTGLQISGLFGSPLKDQELDGIPIVKDIFIVFHLGDHRIRANGDQFRGYLTGKKRDLVLKNGVPQQGYEFLMKVVLGERSSNWSNFILGINPGSPYNIEREIFFARTEPDCTKQSYSSLVNGTWNTTSRRAMLHGHIQLGSEQNLKKLTEEPFRIRPCWGGYEAILALAWSECNWLKIGHTLISYLTTYAPEDSWAKDFSDRINLGKFITKHCKGDEKIKDVPELPPAWKPLFGFNKLANAIQIFNMPTGVETFEAEVVHVLKDGSETSHTQIISGECLLDEKIEGATGLILRPTGAKTSMVNIL